MNIHFIVVLPIFHAEEGLFRDNVDQERNIDEYQQNELNNRIVEGSRQEDCSEELVKIADQRKRDLVWPGLGFDGVRKD